MTEKEAQAFVGDVPCVVNTLKDDKMFLEPPTTQPMARSKRQRRDTSSDPLDLLVSTQMHTHAPPSQFGVVLFEEIAFIIVGFG